MQLRNKLKGIQLLQTKYAFSLLLQGVCWTVRHHGARLMCHPVTPQWAGSTEDCQEVTQRAITNAILISSHPVSYAPHPVTSTIYQVSSQAGIVKSDLVERRNERAVIQIRGKRFSPFPPFTSTLTDLKPIRSARSRNSNNNKEFLILKILNTLGEVKLYYC